MDPQSQAFIPSHSSINETWRFQTDLVKMQQMQAEHAERIARLERRQEDDARIKNVWGPGSPFPSVLGGTPQQAPLQQPPIDHFRNFDDETNNMISSLHLDADDEPRRTLGANSRANSVRFDETANTNHFSHSSRPSSDFMSRTSSALGGLQLSERTMSHKSEGRASSQHSLRSAASGRANSLNMDSSFVAAENRSPLDTPGLAPGLLLLGAVPAIIRCWMNTNFRHDALLYAAVCSGSYKSFLDLRLIQKLGFDSVMRTNNDGPRTVELPVFFPEAIPLTSSSRSSSPAPQLPSLLIEFQVIESAVDLESKAIQIFIGSDVLRAHNADILFSTNNITLYDNERQKLSIPLARPENEAAFNSLFVSSGMPQPATQIMKEVEEPIKSQPYLNGLGQDSDADTQASLTSPSAAKYRPPGAVAAESENISDSAKASTNVTSDYDVTQLASRQTPESRPFLHLLSSTRNESTQDVASPSGETGPSHMQLPPRTSNTAASGSWRRDNGSTTPSQANNKLDWSTAVRTRDANAFLPRRDTSSGIKVLKPKSTSTARAFSSTQASPAPNTASSSPALEGKSSRFFEEGRRRSIGLSDDARSVPESDAKRETATAQPSVAPSTTPKTKSNPIGGASAFSWLNSGAGTSVPK